MASAYEVTRWDAPTEPTEEFLRRWLSRDGLEAVESLSLPVGLHTPELKFTGDAVLVVLAGQIQVSCPGYGVVDLYPGDRLDLPADLLHDVKTIGAVPCDLLAVAWTLPGA